MTPLYIFIISLVALVVLLKWRLKISEQKLEGKSVPKTDSPLHPEGVIYYFYHPRCGPCRSMMPAISELMAKYPGRIEKINVAENREMTLAMGVRATPTTVLVKDNKITKAIIGARSLKAMESMLNTNNG